MKILWIFLSALVIIAIIVVLGLGYITKKSLPNYQTEIPAPNLAVQSTPELVGGTR